MIERSLTDFGKCKLLYPKEIQDGIMELLAMKHVIDFDIENAEKSFQEGDFSGFGQYLSMACLE